MLWRRYFNRGKPLGALKITLPPTKNAVEQLLSLQEAITKVESLIQAGNIVLLKLRALLFAVLPQVYGCNIIVPPYISVYAHILAIPFDINFCYSAGYRQSCSTAGFHSCCLCICAFEIHDHGSVSRGLHKGDAI